LRISSQEELTKWARQADKLWFFLDYDGTLAEFTSTPEVIEPRPEIIQLLERLKLKPQIRLAVISGRRLKDLQALLPVKGIYLAGTYGVEIQTPDGEVEYRLEYGRIRPQLDKIKPQWQSLIAGEKGFFLEDKGWSLALHARFAESDLAERVLQAASLTFEEHRLGGEFRLLGGNRFLEAAPSIAHKGGAVDYLLLKYPLVNDQVVYIGDDDKDEDAFSVIHSHAGLAVWVLHQPDTACSDLADYTFPSPEALRGWLSCLV
jgi:trehalose 6-phosphate phosphatase